MNKIYVGQTALQIKLTTSINLSLVNVAKIKYKKPNIDPLIVGDYVFGEWIAEKEATTTNIYYNILDATDINTSGNWTIWAYLIFNDGKEAPGEPVTFYVYDEGEV